MKCIEELDSGTPRRRRLRLGAGAVALLVAGTLAACGGDDSSDSETTSAASGDTAAQTTATPAEDSGSDSGSGEANGIEEQSADEILAAAREAALGATAVHVAGELDDVTLDLSIVKDEGMTGSISQGEGQGTAEIIAVDDAVYIKGDEAFYAAIGGDEITDTIGDRWLKAPADEDGLGDLAEIGDIEVLFGRLLAIDEPVEKGDVEDVDGTPAVPLVVRGRGTLFIAAEGEPFPLKIVGDENRRGEMVFDGWNEPVELEAPTDVLDAAELERAAGS